MMLCHIAVTLPYYYYFLFAILLLCAARYMAGVFRHDMPLMPYYTCRRYSRLPCDAFYDDDMIYTYAFRHIFAHKRRLQPMMILSFLSREKRKRDATQTARKIYAICAISRKKMPPHAAIRHGEQRLSRFFMI